MIRGGRLLFSKASVLVLALAWRAAYVEGMAFPSSPAPNSSFQLHSSLLFAVYASGCFRAMLAR